MATLLVVGTALAPLEDALQALDHDVPFDRVDAVLAASPDAAGSRRRRTVQQFVAEQRLRDHTAHLPAASVTVRWDHPMATLQRAVHGRPDAVVLADAWDTLVGPTLTLGPDVWLNPRRDATWCLEPGAEVPGWSTAMAWEAMGQRQAASGGSRAGRGFSVPAGATVVAAPRPVLEQLCAVRRLTASGFGVVLPGDGYPASRGWRDWLRGVVG